MTPEQKRARAQARKRAASRGLQVFKLREDRLLPWSYFAAATRDEAIRMLIRTYRCRRHA